MDCLDACTLEEIRNEQIKQIKLQAKQNNAFLNSDGFLYDHDFLYTKENITSNEKKDKNQYMIFVLQLFISLTLFFLYLCYFYELLPINEKLDSIIRYFLNCIN